MSTALVLHDISVALTARMATALNGLLLAADIVVKSPQYAEADKIGLYIYHFNRNPHYMNSPLERVSPSQYRQQILVVDACVVIYSTFADTQQEMNYMENIADDFFRNPFIPQEGGPFDHTVKLTPKNMGLDELNKFWSMFSGKSQALAHFYQLAPIFVFPQRDLLVGMPEVQPVTPDSEEPRLRLKTEIISELEE